MQTVMGTINVGVWLAALIGGAILARYNVRMNRADRRAAARLAIGLTILAIAAWIVSAHHVTTADVELQQTSRPQKYSNCATTSNSFVEDGVHEPEK